MLSIGGIRVIPLYSFSIQFVKTIPYYKKFTKLSISQPVTRCRILSQKMLVLAIAILAAYNKFTIVEVAVSRKIGVASTFGYGPHKGAR